MEDHLKNKDRLEQEWVALCAYEAEPCSTAVALKPENVKKNRYMEILPYDHARVVLNELANASSSDYINASSIVSSQSRPTPRYAIFKIPDGPRSSEPSVHRNSRTVAAHRARLLANGLGAGICRDGYVDATDGKRQRNVSSLLARRRQRGVPHLRSSSRERAHLVR